MEKQNQNQNVKDAKNNSQCPAKNAKDTNQTPTRKPQGESTKKN